MILGGSRYFWGPVIGAVALVALKEIALRFALYHSVVLGVMLVMTVAFLPGGIAGGGIGVLRRLKRAGQGAACCVNRQGPC